MGCSIIQGPLKKAEKKFEKGEYFYAIDAYKEVLKKKPDNAYVNFKIGESYREINRIAEGLDYYKRAVELNAGDEDAQFYYAFALKAKGRYDEAGAQLKKYLEKARNKENIKVAKEEIENLKIVKEVVAKKSKYEIKPYDYLNTPAGEFSPALRENKIIFTSSRGDGKIAAGTGTKFLDLFIYDYSNTTEDKGFVKPFRDEINLEGFHEASATFTKDGRTMVFARSNSGKKKGTKNVDLYISRFKDGKWSEPVFLRVNDPYGWDTSPAFSKDGKTLYFSSDRKGGQGGADIYKAVMDANGNFGRVTNMGPQINTPGDEVFPYASDDGKLYFSSTGHPGLGRLDLFVATKVGKDIKVESLGVPMNSTGDDFGITFKTEKTGYFSSDREGGKGDDDIYEFEDTTPDDKVVNYFLAVTVVPRDSQDYPLENVKVKVLDSDGTIINSYVTGADGRFKMPITIGENYTIIGEKEEYLTKRDFFSAEGIGIPVEQLTKPVTDTTFTMKMPMDKIVINKPIVLENIYYDLDKYNIRDDAAIELDKLVDVLQDNPGIKIELSSHTDSRNTDSYNMTLSQRRAESAVNYIISKGISADRLVAKGYGESRLVNKCKDGVECTEEQHQANRRTEFKVLEFNK
jgi:outer membrane protein OmpA-like peptidoglycan-associated protein/tetratricopeptide (TPR) repeat protein